jgi:hypothetical protein
VAFVTDHRVRVMIVVRGALMEIQLTTDVSESGNRSMDASAQAAERVVSIMDFDSSGMITCLVTKPLVGGLGSVRDSMSTRSITMDEWREINGKQ